MEENNSAEEGLVRCRQYKKDSWERWTSVIWLLLFIGMMLTVSAVACWREGVYELYPFLAVFAACSLVIAKCIDSQRAQFQKDWSERIAGWEDLRGKCTQ